MKMFNPLEKKRDRKITPKACYYLEKDNICNNKERKIIRESLTRERQETLYCLFTDKNDFKCLSYLRRGRIHFTCTRCAEPIFSRSKNAKYCIKCRDEVKKENKRKTTISYQTECLK